MINGAHVMIYSRNAGADRAFLRDVLQLSHVDAGGGWLIFGLPPGEVAVHPAENAETHELYLMCKDVAAFVREMAARSVVCTSVKDEGWGLRTQLTLPGGGTLGVYEPRHPRPKAKQPKRVAARPAKSARPAKARKKVAKRRRAPARGR
jgi:hypothetical protein